MQTRIMAPKREEMERPNGTVESCANSELRVTSRHEMLRKTAMYIVGKVGTLPAAYSAVRSSKLVARNDIMECCRVALSSIQTSLMLSSLEGA